MTQDLEIKRLMRRLGHILYHHYGIKSSQHRVLMILNRHGNLSQKTLLEHMGIQPGSLSELLNKVETNGYIIKHKDDNDKRNYILSLTDEGKKLAEIEENRILEEAEILFKIMDQNEKDEFQKSLKKLLDYWILLEKED